MLLQGQEVQREVVTERDAVGMSFAVEMLESHYQKPRAQAPEHGQLAPPWTLPNPESADQEIFPPVLMVAFLLLASAAAICHAVLGPHPHRDGPTAACALLSPVVCGGQLLKALGLLVHHLLHHFLHHLLHYLPRRWRLPPLPLPLLHLTQSSCRLDLQRPPHRDWVVLLACRRAECCRPVSPCLLLALPSRRSQKETLKEEQPLLLLLPR